MSDAQTIGFTGHRDAVCQEIELDEIARLFPGATWIHGGAPGFDTQVDEYAKAHGMPYEKLRPDYKRYDPKVAPLRRNDVIVERANVLVACYDGRNRGGTYYTVAKAKEKGIRVLFVTVNPMEQQP